MKNQAKNIQWKLCKNFYRKVLQNNKMLIIDPVTRKYCFHYSLKFLENTNSESALKTSREMLFVMRL